MPPFITLNFTMIYNIVTTPTSFSITQKKGKNNINNEALRKDS